VNDFATQSWERKFWIIRHTRMSKYLIARLPISIMCATVNRKGGRNCNFIVLMKVTFMFAFDSGKQTMKTIVYISVP